jgi:LytS/YehU family sensor histidine kinase
VVSIANNEKQMFFQVDNFVSYFKYKNNGWYALRYLTYIGIYLLMLLLVVLIVKGQKLRDAKQRAIEQQISELQIKTVKNQVDPHFVFNAINTISEMTLMDNKLEVDAFIGRFSRFMRNTLQHSDKIATSLKEELVYTENFIKLQQTRFSQRFSYEINIDKNVNLKTMVPKHVLFTYVENAIKHGIAHKEGGMLYITAKQIKQSLVLTVEDNGNGIIETKEPKPNSTGNGLLIMQKIFSLYTKLTKQKIEYRIINLNNKEKNTTGTRIEIVINKSKN